MAGQEQVVEFGEGDGKKPLLSAVKDDLFAKLPKQIEFGEMTGNAGSDDAAVNFAAPDDLPVDQASLKLHNLAVTYARDHNTDYDTALRAVSTR